MVVVVVLYLDKIRYLVLPSALAPSLKHICLYPVVVLDIEEK